MIRPSILTMAFVLAGHGFYFALILSATIILQPTAFGPFYVAWTLLNVLYTPGAVLCLALSAKLADAYRSGGPIVLARMSASTYRGLLPPIAASVLITELALLAGGRLIGVDSVALMLLLPVTAASFVLVEMRRAAIQATLNFKFFGAVWLGWVLLQFTLGLAGLLLTSKPWAGFLGMLTANLIVFAGLERTLGHRRYSYGGNVLPAAVLWTKSTISLFVAFASFVLLNSADVMIAYIVLDSQHLGTYSASAVLPKAIVTATFPIAQVMLPVMVHAGSDRSWARSAFRKAFALTLLLVIAGAAFLFLSSPLVCGDSFGLRYCSPSIMLELAVAAGFVSLIRVIGLADLQGTQIAVATLPALGFIGFTIVELSRRPISEALASDYLICAVVVLVLMAAVKGAYAARAGSQTVEP